MREPKPTERRGLPYLIEIATNLFPIWILIGMILALFSPSLFSWYATGKVLGTSLIVWGLAVIMLAMGMTLRWEDFRDLLRMPKAAGIGLVAQYLIMPSLGWFISLLFQLPTPYAVGLILVGCCPGGTASNVITFLAQANVALSVIMTTCSTLAAIIITPVLTGWLAGQYVPVDGWGLFLTTFEVILLPLLIGMSLHKGAPGFVERLLPVAPLLAVLVITLICSSIIAQSASAIMAAKWQLLGSVIALHGFGFLLGYYFSKVMGFDAIVNRTIAIEVGMQNSGLAVVLAGQHFANPLTAVPGAISSVTHSLLGSFLAFIWRLSKNK
ncbi:bile acid:sodium symporter family protein [Fischerella thermalis]|uniref:bile acid:sodium symporter family protein n=1 Tax=Fischerella thermalis TaxID=372787 RepID=UPI000E0B86F0|nr:bile acid:sodium symporter family protein [Fischerella thermalis]RDH50280.1 transporter [Fischerella thermalis 111/344/542]